jgi:hypothetical protein
MRWFSNNPPAPFIILNQGSEAMKNNNITITVIAREILFLLERHKNYHRNEPWMTLTAKMVHFNFPGWMLEGTLDRLTEAILSKAVDELVDSGVPRDCNFYVEPRSCREYQSDGATVLLTPVHPEEFDSDMNSTKCYRLKVLADWNMFRHEPTKEERTINELYRRVDALERKVSL